MAVERKFVQQGLNKARIGEYFTEQLDRAGYAGMEINRTPVGTQVRVFAEKPGMVIGKGGKLVRRLTNDLSQLYDVDNPQIEVQNVDVPELNAQLMASRLASALERGWYFRKAGHSTLRRIMESGALGCRIVLAGKLTGPRSRIEKIVEGYIVHAGKPAEEIVHHGFATAVRKLGTIGCSIQIVLPDTVLPDVFNLVEVEPPEPAVEEELITVGAQPDITVPDVAVPDIAVPDTDVDMVEIPIPAEAVPDAQSPVETKGIPDATGGTEDKSPAPVEAKGAATGKAEVRNVDGTWEHKHDGIDWHVMTIVHADGE